MPIKNGDVVKLEYEIKFEDGRVFDSTEMRGGDPLKLQLGYGQVIDGFENSIIGMEAGEEKSFTLKPSEAFGEFDPILLEKIPISQFQGDFSLEPDKIVEVVGPNGMSSPARIRLIEDDHVIVDMNHPGAGKTLNFKVKIIETGLDPDPVVNPFSFGVSCDCGCDHHHS
ncbi:MAG: peptidylprolyl isomerase [Promethearchaeota archaeon]|nr:MAG: peptidylprolyl isomerase [Candidatus Lokiarchaeota archaeon]